MAPVPGHSWHLNDGGGHHVQGPTHHHRGCRRGTLQERGRPRLRRVAVTGSSSWSTGTPRRARPPTSPGHDARTRARTRSPPPSRTRSSGSARSCPGRDWTPAPTPSAVTWPDAPQVVPGTRGPPVPPAVSTIWRILTRRGFVVPQPQKRPGHPGDRSPPSNPTNAGRPTPPTGSSPTAPRWRSSTSSTTTPDCSWSQAGPPSPARRRRQLPQRLQPLGNPRQRAHRQRCDLHRQTPPRRPRRPGDRARPARRPVRPLPALPPPDLRQGRTLPADPEEMAGRATPPGHHRRPATPTQPVPPLLQQHPPAPRRRPPHPRTGLHTPDPRPPPAGPTSPPLPRPPRQDRHQRRRHPAARQPAAPHRPRSRARPHPHHSSWSPTSTSASSTPTPANSSENSPSTPPATTSPSAAHPDLPKPTGQEALKCNDVPQHLSTVSRDMARTHNPRMMRTGHQHPCAQRLIAPRSWTSSPNPRLYASVHVLEARGTVLEADQLGAHLPQTGGASGVIAAPR